MAGLMILYALLGGYFQCSTVLKKIVVLLFSALTNELQKVTGKSCHHLIIVICESRIWYVVICHTVNIACSYRT